MQDFFRLYCIDKLFNNCIIRKNSLMKKILIVLIFAIASTFAKAQTGNVLFDLLTKEQKADYLKNLSSIRTSIENASRKKALDTLCLLPLKVKQYQLYSSTVDGVSVRDSVHYFYAGTYLSGLTRYDMYYGYLYRSTAQVPYVKKIPIFSFEVFSKSATLGYKKLRALSVNAQTGELLLIAEDFNTAQEKWSNNMMNEYHMTPVLALSYMVSKK